MERLLIAILILEVVHILITLVIVSESEHRIKKYMDDEALATLNVLLNEDNIKKRCAEHPEEWIDV